MLVIFFLKFYWIKTLSIASNLLVELLIAKICFECVDIYCNTYQLQQQTFSTNYCGLFIIHTEYPFGIPKIINAPSKTFGCFASATGKGWYPSKTFGCFVLVTKINLYGGLSYKECETASAVVLVAQKQQSAHQILRFMEIMTDGVEQIGTEH